MPTPAAYLHSGSLIAAISELLEVHRHIVRTRLAELPKFARLTFPVL
ncbi:hypothetical protein [Corynebacterium durum]|nr:hypothetical protein [Corynebacterium durum]MDO4651554.1 hypothetical protein [Corynebacterium durum]